MASGNVAGDGRVGAAYDQPPPPGRRFGRSRPAMLWPSGGVPMGLSSCSGLLVEGLVAEHGEQDVAAASGEADEAALCFLPSARLRS